MPYKSQKYINVLEKYLEIGKSKYFGNVLEYKYSGFIRNVVKYIPSTLQIVLVQMYLSTKYSCPVIHF